jgi:hypothetical protein
MWILFLSSFTVVCASFWKVEKIQNGGCCHGNQGAKNVKFTPNFTKGEQALAELPWK